MSCITAHPAPLSKFPRQEYWSKLPFPPPEDFPHWAVKGTSVTSALAGRFFTTSAPWKAPYLATDRCFFSEQIAVFEPFHEFTHTYLHSYYFIRNELITYYHNFSKEYSSLISLSTFKNVAIGKILSLK